MNIIRWFVAILFGLSAISLLLAGELVGVVIAAVITYFLIPKKGKPSSDYLDRIVNLAALGTVSAEDIDAGIKLMKGEIAFVKQPATLYLYKKTGTLGGHGLTARFRLAKGVYYRAGAGQLGMAKDWRPEDNGEVVITNKRILMLGSNKTFSATHSKVLDAQISGDGTELFIKRDAGPDWRFSFGEPVEPIENMAVGLGYLQGGATPQ